MNPVDLIELDDEVSINGIHLTIEQRKAALEEIWDCMNEHSRDQARHNWEQLHAPKQ